MMNTLLTFCSRAVLGLTLLGFAAAAQAQSLITVTVGAGTSAASTNALLSTSTTTNKYARTVSIYSAAELLAAGAQAGSFTRIAWFKGGAGEYPANDAQLSIYLKRTTATALSANPVVWATEVVGATPVYTNSALSLPAGTGWKDFVFSAPFAWNGTDNIEVLVDWFRNSTPTADITWQYTAVSATGGAHATQVNSALIPTVRWAANRPNVQLQLAVVSATHQQAPAGWVQVAPNPFAGELQLAVGANSQGQALETILTDALGRTLQQRRTSLGAVRTLQTPAHLVPGIYFLTVRNEKWQQTFRVVHE
ncbi:T9SS type A sorting domain-containing protein [Hymenobacter sp. BT186]|uniref:T9SS type A sorting domain-containing protein n=1 Tax=Hymenobacter telluris TaxID=2816474 RepID=A0A939F0H7_9BACT|nr:T9SS type A sorting domain-containing protein [Hymenobacter telluris]MBO0360918.1 T9SS type A sorting domain-containing protein [Hymenobacter telluris]MBW3376947.1 T9SS type A sorting domain-containing protein [Hymenobacter norwichensis]